VILNLFENLATHTDTHTTTTPVLLRIQIKLIFFGDIIIIFAI